MMRKIKYILLFLLSMVFLCILFIAIIATALDDADYRKMVIRAVEFFTGYEVNVEGDFTLDLSIKPYLSASGVRFEPGKNGSQPYIDHIGKFQLKLDATHLIAGKLLIKQLAVDDATLSLTIGKDQQKRSTGARKKKGISSVLIPVFENVDLRNIKIDILNKTNGDLAKVELRKLTIDDIGESGYRYVKGEGIVNLQDFRIEGRLGSVAEILNPHQPCPVSMNVKTSNFDLNVSGKIGDLIRGEGFDLQFSGEVADLSNTLRLFMVECSGFRRMTFKAGVIGNISTPKVSNLYVNISGDSNTQVTAKGSVSNIFNGDGTDIFITGSTSNNDIIRTFLPSIVADFSQLDIRCWLRKHQTKYAFEDIDANGSNDQGLAMKAFGSLNLGDLKRNPFIEEIDLDLQLTSPTTGAAKRFLIDWLPEIGPVSGKGRLTGSVNRLSLEDLSIDINESGPLQVTSKGRIGQIPTKKGMNISELDLGVSIQTEKTTLLSTALDIPLPELGSVSAHFRVYYTDDRLQFDEVDVRTSDMKGLEVALFGRVGEIPGKTLQPYGNVDFRIRMTAPNLGAAEPLLGVRILRDIGPVIGEAQITGNTEVLSLINVVVTAGQPSTVRMEMRGRINKIPLKSGRIMAECDIRGLIHTEETSNLGSLFGVSIPNLGPLSGAWRVVDRNGGFGFDDIKLFMGQKKGFRLEAEGKIDSVDRHDDISVAGIDVDISAEIPHVSTISFLKDIGLSNLGSLKMKAKISGGNGGLDIQQLTIHTRQKEKASLLMKGEVHGAQRKDKIEVTGKFEAHTQPWAEKLIQRPISESFKLLGQLKLTGDAEHIRIEKLQIETEGQEPLTLQISGMAKKMDGSYKTDVQMSVNAKDPSVIGSILGISLPSLSPLKANGRFDVSAKKAEFEGEMRFGKSVLKTNARRSIQNHKPHMDLTIYSPVIYLSDMGVNPEESIEETDKKKAIQPGSGQLFSKEPLSFDVFKSLDLSLNIDADKLIGKNFEMNHLDFDLSLSDGWLHIGPAKLDYAGGNISFETTLKTVESKPEIILKANAEDLDVDAVLAYAHKPLILGGQLNLAVDLHGAGSSFHEIASSLEGEFGVAIENGRIKRDIEMITADAIDVITALPKIEDYQDLNCLVLKFTFADGVGKSKIIFYDTPNVRTRGGGSVDLASETLDIVLQPRPKKGIPELSSAIYINGSLSNPSIRKIPFKEAARLAGEILMPYVFLPARALGYLWYVLMDDKDEQSPCLIEGPNGE